MPPIVIDILLVVILVIVLIQGWRRGLLASLGTIAGLVLGAVAAWWLVPVVSRWVPDAAWRGWAALGVAVGLLVLGASLGGALGRALRRGATRIRLRGVDRVLGAGAMTVVAALVLSLVGQSVAALGIPFVSSALASSAVLRTIDTITPRPVDEALAQVRSSVLDDGLPQLGALFGELTAPTETAPPVDLDDPALSTAAQSVARIAGTAYSCGRNLTGSGFVVAPDRVMTNAHVIAGVERPMVELPGRAAREGRVVYVDATADLALIAVDDLDAAALPIGADLGPGAAAVVQGYPYGGPFTMGSATVQTVGVASVPDIYDQGRDQRDVYALAATVRPGNSGGPLLNAAGEVVGIVFARADDGSDIGYASTATELAPVVEAAPTLTDAVGSGACVP
ncbi:MarP family serine protease [Microbacterium sp. Clip185]|uniref:MarP family serine protease n=1 Tax=Microbacterium sp. Clip185 TaxID=3025663 RepID=UPI002366495C|nr:MarP family serine protease [Microbacterium sp. Clip185]WDG16957.1 MarP family serine protease [Microbacterium sp. Clip185]